MSKLVRSVSGKVRGFTLIEILVVIGIIAVLAAIVIIAINPPRQFAQARNTQRVSDSTQILNAIGQNIADNKGIFTCSTGATLNAPTASSTITNGAAGGTAPAGLSGTTINLSCLAPTYMGTFPTDPDTAWLSSGTNYTGYEVSTDATGHVTICAPRSKNETAISATPPVVCITR